MKTFLLALVLASAVGLVATPLQTSAQSTPPPPQLVGILNVGEVQAAVLEVSERSSVQLPDRRRQVILREGQSQFGVELIALLPETGAVKIVVAGKNENQLLELKDRTSLSAASSQGLGFEGADLASVLKLYAELTKRTVLRYPALPNAKLTLNLATTNRAEIAAAIETAAASQGIVLVPDGEKFVLVAPAYAAATLDPKAASIPSGTNDLILAGSFNWAAASVTQALPIYAELLGLKLDQSALPPRMPKAEISLFNQTALTRAELSYALETLFRWNGIQLVPAADGIIKAVPVATGPSKSPVK
jgi:hypothetical protein